MVENRINQQMRDWLYCLYIQGQLDHAQIALEVGITHIQAQAFYQANKKAMGLPKPPRKPRKKCPDAWNRKSTLQENLQEGYALYTSGLTLDEVGKKYGNITRERVRQIFEKAGLPRIKGRRKRWVHFYCQYGHELGKREDPGNCGKCKEVKRNLSRIGLLYKQFCHKGHPLLGDNLLYSKVIRADGSRQKKCKICTYAAIRRYSDRKRQERKNVL